MFIRILAAASVATILITPVYSQAPITYVDADSAPPLPTSTPFGDLGDSTTGNTTIDLNAFATNFWRVRDQGIGGNLYQFRSGTDGEDPVTLITSISGSSLSNGTSYNIYAFFWDDFLADSETNPAWYIDASLDGVTYTNFSAGNGAPGAGVTEAADLPIGNLIDVNTTSNLPITNDGVDLINSLTPGTGNDRVTSEGGAINTDLYAALVGTVVADGNDVQVFIRNDIQSGSPGDRVWYDGVGFQEVDGAPICDANGNGICDVNDYTQEIGPDFLTSQTPGAGGDINGDGFVDLRDFNLFQRFRSDSPLAGSAAGTVPEPSSLLLAICAGCYGFSRRIRQQIEIA